MSFDLIGGSTDVHTNELPCIHSCKSVNIKKIIDHINNCIRSSHKTDLYTIIQHTEFYCTQPELLVGLACRLIA